MSGAIVRGHAQALAKTLLMPPARDDVLAVLRRLDGRFAQFVYEVGWSAGLPRDELYARTSSLLFQYASIQVADDLADNECNYLPDTPRVGPGTQWLLGHLYMVMLRRTRISAQAILRASEDFTQVGQGQQEEVRTSKWTLNGAVRAATMLNGCQYRAHLTLLLAGTPVERWAAGFAQDFGFALHVVGDCTADEARWTGLGPNEKRALALLGYEAAFRARGSNIRAIENHLGLFARTLTGRCGEEVQLADQRGRPGNPVR